MRILIINTDYEEFLKGFYSENPGLQEKPYAEQMEARAQSLFGVADFYSKGFKEQGHEAWEVHANNFLMQKAWVREHPRGHTDWILKIKEFLRRGWFYGILKAQIKFYKPDVVFNQSMPGIAPSFLKGIKEDVRLIVGQHAAMPLSAAQDWSVYDLVVSSFPATVDWFRNRGLLSKLNRMAFDPSVNSALGSREKEKYDITFVGSLQEVHSTRIEFLERLCEEFEQLKIWGPRSAVLKKESPIYVHYEGEAWGRKMYEILQMSKITLNHHGNVPPYANNMRLYEATGVGTMLLTDHKENLKEIFEVGKEVVAYQDADQAIDLIKEYLKDDLKRENVARNGQARTLQEHTYAERTKELLEMMEAQICDPIRS